LVACSRGPSPEEIEAREQAKLAARAAEEQARAAAERAESERLAAETARAEQARADQEKRATAARERVTACCEALARRSFEDRSVADREARRLCIEARDVGRALPEASRAAQDALEDRPLPAACLP
jgi:hypothetical protein